MFTFIIMMRLIALVLICFVSSRWINFGTFICLYILFLFFFLMFKRSYIRKSKLRSVYFFIEGKSETSRVKEEIPRAGYRSER